MARARFATRNIPIVTYTLIAINTLVYLVCLVLSGFNLGDTTGNIVTILGVEGGTLTPLPDPFQGFQLTTLQQDPLQAYRIFCMRASFTLASICCRCSSWAS